MARRTHSDDVAYPRPRFADARTRRRFRVMERVVLERLEGCHRVLDIGCGTGRLTERIGAPCVIGIDIQRGALAIARQRGLAVVLGDGQALPFSDGAFDGVLSTDSAFSQLDPERAFAECARVLVDGGVLAIHHPSDRVWSARRPFGLVPLRNAERDYSGPALLAFALRHGFAVERIHLWRWLRVAPYLMPVPPFAGLRVWNHGVFVFRKQAAEVAGTRAPARRRPPLFRLGGTITVRMRLPPTGAQPSVGYGITVREIGRDELEAVFAASALPGATLRELDAGAPRGWRCFGAFDEGSLRHHSFVARRDEGWVLYRVATAPTHARRGLFRAVAYAIADAVHRDGVTELYSKIGVQNPISLRAHLAAGFEETGRRYDPMVLGMDTRKLLRDALVGAGRLRRR